MLRCRCWGRAAVPGRRRAEALPCPPAGAAPRRGGAAGGPGAQGWGRGSSIVPAILTASRRAAGGNDFPLS